MTSDLDLYQNSPPPAPTGDYHSMRLVEWAAEARAAHALAESLCQTPFAGQYQGNPIGGTAAILKGAEVGLTPVTALGAFDLIQGTPAPKAITLRALVQSHGHTVWVEASSDQRCVAHARRRGENVTHTSEWTMARAKNLGLDQKTNWKKQPAAMLVARATAEVCRLVAADVILGIGYSSEEITDNADIATAGEGTAAPTTTRRRTAKRAQPNPPPEPDEPSLDEPAPPDAPADDNTPAMVTSQQMKKLQATFGDLGVTERDQRLTITGTAIGRAVGSANELTRDEAATLIDRLDEITQLDEQDKPLVLADMAGQQDGETT